MSETQNLKLYVFKKVYSKKIFFVLIDSKIDAPYPKNFVSVFGPLAIQKFKLDGQKKLAEALEEELSQKSPDQKIADAITKKIKEIKRLKTKPQIQKIQKICKGCGIEFSPRKGFKFQTFHSVECRTQFYDKLHPLLTKICPICHVEFSTRKSYVKYCSDRCYKHSKSHTFRKSPLGSVAN